MTLSSDLVTAIAGALAVFVGAIVVFGIRCADKSDKLNEKSQTDELNEIRSTLRQDITLPAVDRLWQFLAEVNEKFKKEDPPRKMDVNLLLLDFEVREPFNKLLNDVEKSFGDDLYVREVWTLLKSSYSRFAHILYAYAATVGSLGFFLLFLNLTEPTLFSQEEFIITWGAVLIVGILFLIPLVCICWKITKNKEIYEKKKKEYQDKVRI
jgi:hypothetical protein